MRTSPTGSRLPAPATPLLGREGAVEAVVDELARHRMVSLAGTGGVGKTRLAIAVAQSIAAVEIVRWVDLGPVSVGVSGEGAVATAAVDALDVLVEPGSDPYDALARQLAGARVVVVLDNCEHPLDGCARWVERALERVAGLRVLATSREPLAVSGEHVRQVPPLDLDASEALFELTARRVRSNAVVDGDERSAVRSICERLDGVPLAIELAAARCRSMAPTRIDALLADRFRLLTTGPRTANARQQTLLASVEWSHQLLEPDEQIAFRRLGVFAGAFDLDAAEDVLAAPGDLDRFAVIDLLDRLVSKSLVITDDGHRYRLYETLRLHALDRLAESGEDDVARHAHCDHYAAFVSSFLDYPDDRDLPGLIERQTNIDVALEWAIDSRPEQIEALLRACAGSWFFRHRFGESQVDVVGRAIPALVAYDARAATRAFADLSEVVISFAPRRVESHLDELERMAIELRVTSARARVELYRGIFETEPSRLVRCAELAEAPDDDDPSGSEHVALGARIQRTIAFARRGELLDARRSAVEHEHAALRGGIHPLIDATARILTAREWGGIDEALDHGLVVSNERWQAGFRDTAMHASLCWSGYMAAVVARRQDVFDGFARNVERVAALSPLGAVIQTWLAGASEAMSRELVDVTPWIRQADELAFGAHRRVEAVVMVLGSGLHEQAAEMLAPLQRHHPDWPSVRCTAALIDGLADRNSASLHEGLEVAMRHGARRTAIDLLEALAVIAHDAGRHDEAARIAGSATSARRELDAYRFRMRHTDALDELRASQPWHQGSGLSLDEIVAWARRGRGARRRAVSGWASLTPTERRVVADVVEGRSNADVAANLFMSLGTVKTHLAHVYTKLEISDRAALVRYVHTRRDHD